MQCNGNWELPHSKAKESNLPTKPNQCNTKTSIPSYNPRLLLLALLLGYIHTYYVYVNTYIESNLRQKNTQHATERQTDMYVPIFKY